MDFGAVYGEEFAFLGQIEPHSVLLAKGSDIAVYKGTNYQMIIGIVAVAKNNAIGKDGKLPWHYSADLKFFKETTTGTRGRDGI